MKSPYLEQLKEVTSAVHWTSLVIPAQRALHNKGFSFSKLSFEEQLKIWDHIWKNGGWRAQIHAFFFLEKHLRHEHELRVVWETTHHWQLYVGHWGTCDALAKIYTKVLEVMPKEVYAQLFAWNTDKNPWCRRQSLVSLLYYSRTKKSFLKPKQVTDLVTNLLADKEYYVQKGLGWCLREFYNVYPKEAMVYIEKHLKQLSSIAFTITAEKMELKYKEILKQQRRSKT